MTAMQSPSQRIQFGQQYDGQKLRALEEEVFKLQAALNRLIVQLNNLSTETSDGLDSLALDDLTDVSTSGAQVGEVLMRAGSGWVPGALPAIPEVPEFGELAELDVGDGLQSAGGLLNLDVDHNDLPGLTTGDPHTQYVRRDAYAKQFLLMGA